MEEHRETGQNGQSKEKPDWRTRFKATAKEWLMGSKDPVKLKKQFYVFRTILLSLILGFGTLMLLWWWNLSTQIPPVYMIERPELEFSSVIYSAEGEELRTLYSSEYRIEAKPGTISPWVERALISIEDQRFYEHKGVDPIAFGAVFWGALTGKDVRGGSTITMQLSRNLYEQVGKSQTVGRKFREIFTAISLERMFTKDEIINAYLNTVSFYGNTYGIATASDQLFDKAPSDLQPHEAALLVALLKGPSYYSPTAHPDRALARRNLVLSEMHNMGFLSESQKDSLQELPLGLEMEDSRQKTQPGGYFTEYVRYQADQWARENGYDLYRDGLRIHTTLNYRMQLHAESSVDEHMEWLQNIFSGHIRGYEPWRGNASREQQMMRSSDRYIKMKDAGASAAEIREAFNSPVQMGLFTWQGVVDTTLSPMDSLKYYETMLRCGFAAIDPYSGHVKAWVGGPDYRYFQYDHVAFGKRQPGSTFKPFTYAVALQGPFEPCSYIRNEPVIFEDDRGNVIWAPENAGGDTTGGLVTLKEGLAKSLNLIAAHLMKEVGPEAVCKMAHACGIQSDLECVPSIALGTSDVTLLEIVNAYSTFVNQGFWTEPVAILRIEDRNGNILQTFAPESRRAIDERLAYTMVRMLQQPVLHPEGTAHSLMTRYGLGGEIGGKTGTTQEHADGWFVGISPGLVAGAWVGGTRRDIRFRTIRYGQGAVMALPIYARFMQKVYADRSIEVKPGAFDAPVDYNVKFDCPPPFIQWLEENILKDGFKDIFKKPQDQRDEDQEEEKPKKKKKLFRWPF